MQSVDCIGIPKPSLSVSAYHKPVPMIWVCVVTVAVIVNIATGLVAGLCMFYIAVGIAACESAYHVLMSVASSRRRSSCCRRHHKCQWHPVHAKDSLWLQSSEFATYPVWLVAAALWAHRRRYAVWDEYQVRASVASLSLPEQLLSIPSQVSVALSTPRLRCHCSHLSSPHIHWAGCRTA